MRLLRIIRESLAGVLGFTDTLLNNPQETLCIRQEFLRRIHDSAMGITHAVCEYESTNLKGKL